jgi:hypothetical protein
MTRDEILAMEAGREMDRLICEEIFMIDVEDGHEDWFYEELVPHYSTSISAAWEVVLHEMNNGSCPNLINDDDGHWALSFEGTNNVPCTVQTSFIKYPELWCDEAPIAICRAVLLEALEGE